MVQSILDEHVKLQVSFRFLDLRIWRLLETGRPLNEVLGTMLDEYAVSPEQMELDLGSFIEQLHQAGLVSVQPA